MVNLDCYNPVKDESDMGAWIRHDQKQIDHGDYGHFRVGDHGLILGESTVCYMCEYHLTSNKVIFTPLKAKTGFCQF